MDTNTLLQTELTRIEEVAAKQTRQIIEAQDTFIAAHILLGLLKKHGADEELDVTPLYFTHKVSMIIYPGNHSDETLAAIRSADIEIREVQRGFNNDVTKLILCGYEAVDVYVSDKVMDWRKAA